MPAPLAPRPFKTVETNGLSPLDAYSFDVGGWIVVRGALDAAAVSRCRDVRRGDEAAVFTAVAEEQQRGVLAPYLHGLVFEGSSFGSETAVLDSAPTLLAEHTPLAAETEHFYHAGANGVAITQGVRCFWALTDLPGGGPGGFCILPASHNARVDAPSSVLRAGAADDLLLWPRLAAGDLLVAASSLVFGVRPWPNERDGPQLVLHAEFLSTTARGRAVEAGMVSPEGSAEVPAWSAELTDEERAVLGWGDPSAPLLTDGKTTWVGPTGTPRVHPAVHVPSQNEAVDEVEFYKWDLCGHLVLPNVMDDDWIADAERAIDAHPDLESARHSTEPVPAPRQLAADRDSWQQIGPFGGSSAPRLSGLLEMEAPHAAPFRRMVTDPRVTQRLTWMMGTHYTIASLPSAIVSVDGAAGVYLHAGGTHIDPTGVLTVKSGVSRVGYINIAWTLRDVRPEQGGFCAIAGSHKARLPLPGCERWADTQGYGLSADPAPLEASGHLRHVPLGAGSVVIFQGAAQTHGAYTWRGDEERRTVLYGAYPRAMKGSFTGRAAL